MLRRKKANQEKKTKETTINTIKDENINKTDISSLSEMIVKKYPNVENFEENSNVTIIENDLESNEMSDKTESDLTESEQETENETLKRNYSVRVKKSPKLSLSSILSPRNFK